MKRLLVLLMTFIFCCSSPLLFANPLETFNSLLSPQPKASACRGWNRWTCDQFCRTNCAPVEPQRVPCQNTCYGFVSNNCKGGAPLNSNCPVNTWLVPGQCASPPPIGQCCATSPNQICAGSSV